MLRSHGRARRSYDSGPSTTPPPPPPTLVIEDGDDEQSDSSTRYRYGDHRRSASSNDATPRPKPTILRSSPSNVLPTSIRHERDQRRQHCEALLDTDSNSDFDSSAPAAHHYNPNIDILTSDPFLAAHPRKLGFFTASTSPSKHLNPRDRSHSRPPSERDPTILSSTMTSVSSSNTLKTHTSPSKVCLPFIGHAILEIDVRHLSLPHGLTMQSSFHEKCTASALSQA